MGQRPFDEPETARILDFLDAIGISVKITELAEATFLPGMTVRGETLLLDPDRLTWPGDLLHEAGHIAVADPLLREPGATVSAEPGEEIAAIAWSYAAAMAIGLPTRTVFHEGGYRGEGASLAENFENGQYIGVPLLQWFGMASVQPGTAMPPYPHMMRWQR
jgi:hypothetical protein